MQDLLSLVVVDPDSRSRDVLAFGFERAGFAVHATGNPDDALKMARSGSAALVVESLPRATDAPLVLLRAIQRVARAGSAVPMVMIGDATRRDEALAGGAAEFISRPAFLRDVIVLGGLAAARHGASVVERRIEDGGDGGAYVLARALVESRATARVVLERSTARGRRLAELQFQQGELTDARAGRQRGSNAWLLALLWTEGRAVVDFGAALPGETRARRIQRPTERLLEDGPRFAAEFRDVAARVGGPDAVFRQDESRTEAVALKIPREVRAFLSHFDGTRAVQDLVEDAPFPPFDTLVITHRLADLGAIVRDGDRPKPEVVPLRPVPAVRAAVAAVPVVVVETRSSPAVDPPAPRVAEVPPVAVAPSAAPVVEAPPVVVTPSAPPVVEAPPVAPPPALAVTPSRVAAVVASVSQPRAPAMTPVAPARADSDVGVARSPARSAAKKLRRELFGDSPSAAKVTAERTGRVRKSPSERTGKTRLAPPPEAEAVATPVAAPSLANEQTVVHLKATPQELAAPAPVVAAPAPIVAPVAAAPAPIVAPVAAAPAPIAAPVVAAPAPVVAAPVVVAPPVAAAPIAASSAHAVAAAPAGVAKAPPPVPPAAKVVTPPHVVAAPIARAPREVPSPVPEVVADVAPAPALVDAPPPSREEVVAARIVTTTRREPERRVAATRSSETDRIPRVAIDRNAVELPDMQRLAEMTHSFRKVDTGRQPRVGFDPIDEEFFARESELQQVESPDSFDDLDKTRDDDGYAGGGLRDGDERTDGWFFFGRRRDGLRKPGA